jgi:hypothetical protein
VNSSAKGQSHAARRLPVSISHATIISEAVQPASGNQPPSKSTHPPAKWPAIRRPHHCFKLLGQRVMARTFDRQITELKVRAAILNRFSQIGTPNTVRVG